MAKMASVVRDTSESKASLTAKVGFIKGRTTLRLWMTVTAFAVGVCAAASAFAQGYPAQPVRVIVPFAKGGGVDVIARLVSQKLSELWGQRVTDRADHRPSDSRRRWTGPSHHRIP